MNTIGRAVSRALAVALAAFAVLLAAAPQARAGAFATTCVSA